MFEHVDITELSDFKFGHADAPDAGTGCTVIIAPEGARAGVSVSGGGPATRETDLLKPEKMIQNIHAVVLAGGSAFGLEASCGVMDALAKREIGFEIAGMRVPIVTGACLFDLTVGSVAYPDKAMGKTAVEHAFSSLPFEMGNVGAGTGASVGKLCGPEYSMKSGFGFTVLKRKDLVVGAFVAVNAAGNIGNPDRGWLAGCRNDEGDIVDGVVAFDQAIDFMEHSLAPTNTTIGVIVTNAMLDKAQATKVATITNDAYARAIKPVHTSHDGDAIFALASSKVIADPDLVAILATEAMEQAIYEGVRSASSAYDLPSAKDMR